MAVFEDLNGLNINGHTEEKNVGGTKLTYLSWPWAWAEVKKRYPDAHYTIWKDEYNLPYAYDPRTGFMVYTSVTIEGVTHEMWLPVMDGANRAMKAEPYKYATKYGGEKSVDAATMMDINKTIMRCLVKNLAMFGLGLYIYAGEDLPEVEQEEQKQARKVQEAPVRPQSAQKPASVATVDKIPAPAPKVPEKAPDKPETPGRYIMRRLEEITPELVENFNFVKARKALIDGGVIKDIPSAVITMEQAQALIDAIVKNFRRPEAS